MENKIANFDIGDMLPIGLTLIVLGIGLSYGLNVMEDIQGDYVDGSTACGVNSTGGTGGTILYSGCGAGYNATTDAIAGVAKLPEKMGLIATVIVAAIIIGILVRYLMVKYA